MWVLECDGDVLKDKRLWLRPGKKYLFGRTAKSDEGEPQNLPFLNPPPERFQHTPPPGKEIHQLRSNPSAGGFAIENKSISRKHLTIEVAPVKRGDGSKLHTKSQLTISDLNSKFGTQLDGEQVVGESRILNSNEHEIKLGSYEHSFRHAASVIKWAPVVLSFSFSTKEQKNKDPLEPVRTRLEPLDIKVVIPYVIESTTHVVATKRNTAKGLQALINAKYIVTDSFVDAIVLAATPERPDIPESLSPLEADFDCNWPDPLSHLPPQNKEPSQRSSAFFAPDPKRANIFEGYTFIFCDNVQYENLHPPIANGGGKALLFELRMGKTTVEEMVRYVKNVAGDKGTRELDNQSGGKGVVVVRFRGKKGMEKWSIELGNEVARKLDQRLIEQSEFLDAILVNDASGLRKALPEEDDNALPGLPAPAGKALLGGDQPRSGTNIVPEASMLRNERSDEHEIAPQPAPEPLPTSQQPNNRIRPRFVTSRFKGFDDGFNPASPQLHSGALDDGLQTRNPPDSYECTNDESRLELLREPSPEIDSQPSKAPNMRNVVSRKRTSPPSEDEDHDDVMNKILPAAAAMKKRRIEVGDNHRHVGMQDITGRKESSAPQRAKGRKPKKEIDVLGAAREHREAEEYIARRDQEALKVSLDGMEIDQMKNLVLVEDMEIVRRPDRHSRVQAYGDSGSRWDERWNGRKNFKRFKRRDVGNDGQVRRGGNVIIDLEEVRKKDFGIGDGYWLEGNTRKGKQTESRGPNELESLVVATAGARSSKDTRRQQGNYQATEQPRVTRLADKTKGGRQTEPADTGKSQVPNKKRGASPTGAKPSPAKKRNGLFVRQSDSDDSEDDLKFRFRRKR